MFPRRSTVLRYLACASLICAVFLVWLSSTSTNEWIRLDTTAWLHAQPDLMGANETELMHEIERLQNDFDQQQIYILTNSSRWKPPVNASLDDLRQRVVDLRRTVPVNPHHFVYIINPSSACTGNIFLLIYVHSAPSHFKQRMVIRETWGNARHFSAMNLVIKLVFLMGITSEKDVQDALLMEADAFGDIVQENFIDSYRNLTYKGIMGLKWVSVHCRKAQFLLKTDDDIFVNMFNLVHHLKNKLDTAQNAGRNVSRLLLCLVWTRMKVVREKTSKWYLSPAEFSDEYFPTYCSGSAFILTTDIAAEMYSVSLRIPFFWVDDFYVTGLLAREVGVEHEKFNEKYTLAPGTFFQRFTERSVWQSLIFGHVHNMKHMRIVWNNVLNEQNQTKKNITGSAPPIVVAR